MSKQKKTKKEKKPKSKKPKSKKLPEEAVAMRAKIILAWAKVQEEALIVGTACLMAVFSVAGAGAILSWKYFFQKERMAPPPIETVETAEPEEAPLPIFDVASWKTYQNQWYGFDVKYPSDWSEPVFKSATAGAKWEYRYLFREKNEEGVAGPAGFDVVVYSTKRVPELMATEEFTLKTGQELPDGLGKDGPCDKIEGHLDESGQYPAEEIHINPGDSCYEAAFFYSLTRDQYTYNIVPVFGEVGEGEDRVGNELKRRAKEEIPEFFSVASHFDLVEIKRPKPKPVITAPKPADYKTVNGRMVCGKKNDKPGKSKQDKDKHLDMECCLDPDEYPNPHCYYDSAKYGKYLK